MTTAKTLPAKAVGSVRTLTIRDCTFFFRCFFAAPRSFQSVAFQELADTLLSAFRDYNLTATDISLDRGDCLFGYSVRIQMFNGLMSFVINATTVDCTFTRLWRTADRRLASDCIRKIVDLFGNALSDFSYFEIALHADFSSKKDRDDFLSRKIHEGLDFWGILGYKQLDDSGQRVRLEVDESWTYPDGAFFSWRTIGMKRSQLFSVDPIWGRFFALLEPFDLGLQDD